MQLLLDLCKIHSPSGEEVAMKAFILDYVTKNHQLWPGKLTILEGPELQDNIILVFGKPTTAIFAHMDTIGFTVRYENQLVPIGSPDPVDGTWITGEDPYGLIRCQIKIDSTNRIFYDFGRAITRGTSLAYESKPKIAGNWITAPYLDNRIGIYNALKTAETLKNGIIAFSSWEEHGGGAVPILARNIYEQFQVRQALISDVTWVTEGVHPGKGVAVSMRDRNIPRRSYIQKIFEMATASEIPFQLEVEASGSSDGRELQISPYPFDWCFIGPPIDGPHTPKEKLHVKDLESTVQLYAYLMKNL